MAIVYFKNISGDSEIDRWKTDFPDYLMADLGQSKYINVVEDFRIYSALKDLGLLNTENYSETDLRKICEMREASHILTGRFLKSGVNYEVQVTLFRADTLESLGTVAEEGRPPDEILALVDPLTRGIKNLFGFSDTQIADDIDLGIGDIRTESKEAWDYYVKGLRAGDVENNPEQAIKYFEKALEFDPEFGRVWVDLSIQYYNSGRPEEAKKCAEKAIELGGKMTVKDLKLAEAALYAGSERTLDKLFQAYQEILRDYPDEIPANANLGFHYFILEEYDDSIKYNGNLYRRKINPIPYLFLAKAYSAKGLYAKAEECLNYYIINVKDDDELHAELALTYLCQGDKEKALLEIEKSPKSDPTLPHLYAQGQILYCMEDFIEAENAFEELKQSQYGWYQYCAYKNLHNTLFAQGRFIEARTHLESGMDFTEKEGMSDYGSEFYVQLMSNFLKAGQVEKAISVFEKSWEVVQNAGIFTDAYRRRLMYLKGMAALAMDERDIAQTVAASLKELIDSGMNKKAIRIFYHLSGMIEEREGNFERALELYSDALELAPYEYNCQVYLRLDRAPYLESMGLVYFKMGELDKAIEQFEKIQGLTLGRVDYGDIYAKSYYNLGKIFEQKGWIGKAIESYEKFLSLWKDADPGIAEVEDAKKRLNELK